MWLDNFSLDWEGWEWVNLFDFHSFSMFICLPMIQYPEKKITCLSKSETICTSRNVWNKPLSSSYNLYLYLIIFIRIPVRKSLFENVSKLCLFFFFFMYEYFKIITQWFDIIHNNDTANNYYRKRTVFMDADCNNFKSRINNRKERFNFNNRIPRKIHGPVSRRNRTKAFRAKRYKLFRIRVLQECIFNCRKYWASSSFMTYIYIYFLYIYCTSMSYVRGV